MAVGAVLASLGLSLSYFAQSIYALFLTSGIVTGMLNHIIQKRYIEFNFVKLQVIFRGITLFISSEILFVIILFCFKHILSAIETAKSAILSSLMGYQYYLFCIIRCLLGCRNCSTFN